MHIELYLKALKSAEAARDSFDEENADSAVNRAYYAVFNAARAFLASVGVTVDGSHGAIVQLFGLHAIMTKKVEPEFGRRFNLLQGARSIADYDQISVSLAEAKAYVEDAEKFLDEIGGLLPSLPSHARRGLSAKEKADVDVRRSLAVAFCKAVESRGETPPPGLEEQLVLYGTRESLTRMIAELNEMNDLASFISQRCPDLHF
jgi:uncharacterized protein (UPF0332 family)